MRSGLPDSVLQSIETLFSVGSVMGMTDGQLLEQFLARRDESADTAFSSLVARHGPMVWRVCRGALSDTHAAEDAFQATFLILVRKAASIRQRETLAPWLYGVARRVVVRARKSANRKECRWGQIAEMKVSSMPDPSRQEELEALHQELDRLPAKYRAVLVLCHLEGRTHAEVGRLLNCPAATVSIRVSRARERVRARLARRGFALSAGAGVALGCGAARAALPAGLAESTVKAALYLAAGHSMKAGVVPAAVFHLTEGMLRTMSLHKFAVTATCLLVAALVPSRFGLFAMIELARAKPEGAVAAEAHPREPDHPLQESPHATDLLPQQDEAKARDQSAKNLKRIGLAMHNYAAADPADPTPSFPADAITKDGKPLLSWRVALLPHLELANGVDPRALYDKFHLEEAWDSPHNRALLEQMPSVYAPVVPKGEPKGSTYYQVFVGPGALFEGSKGMKQAEVTDGMQNTLLVVEAAKAVPWTKPEDLPFDKGKRKDNPLPMLGGQFDHGFHAAVANGAVFLIGKMIDATTLRALITRDGGEVFLLNAVPSTPAFGLEVPFGISP